MIKKIVAVALVAAFVPLTGYAAEAENSATLPLNDKPSPAQGKSFFEGTWAGEWHAFKDPSLTQDVTLNILKMHRETEEGVFLVHYSWGIPPSGTAFPPAGSVKKTGKEDGDQFILKWKNTYGDVIQITLKKAGENKVAARQERISGALRGNQRPYMETYLFRK
jgi:hypothetical protein